MPDATDTEKRRAKRFTFVGFVLAGAAATIFVGGTLLSLMSADDSETEPENRERPPLSELVETSQLIAEGTAERVERFGDASDPGVIATIEIDTVIASPAASPDEVIIYDQDFRENWTEGQRLLLFLGVEGSLPGDAEFRVRDRCVLEDVAMPCPYDAAEIRRAVDDL